MHVEAVACSQGLPRDLLLLKRVALGVRGGAALYNESSFNCRRCSVPWVEVVNNGERSFTTASLEEWSLHW